MPRPLSDSRKAVRSCSDRDSVRSFSCGVRRSCRLVGRKSSSPPKRKPSSQSSLARCLGRLADTIFGLATRLECIRRWPRPSSPDPRGDEPRVGGARPRDSLPKAESWRVRRASEGRAAFFGSEEGGESRPNFDGTDAATGPCRAAKEMPWLSNDAGKGASRALRCATGDIGRRPLSGGEPYVDPRGDV